jgi:hypothetical protein
MRRLLGLAVAPLAALLMVAAGVGSAYARETSKRESTKIVRYQGFAVVVPAAWPVYDLRTDPRVCVRFDSHALYLGRPGTDQQCPPRALGRTEAILVEPRQGANESPLPGRGHGQFTLVTRGVEVTATWAEHPDVVKRALGVRSLATGRGAAARAHAAAASPSARASAAGSTFKGLGFDACAAPSQSRMSAWLASPYRAVGIYLGGTNMACAQPNLTSSWVSVESAAGWHLIPTYVGLQAPSNDCRCAAINPARASAEGAAAAQDAVDQAQALGIGPGNPIYDDMENYTRGGRNTPAVLAFLSAWTSTLHGDGYLSGVYSNADSGISDLVGAQGTGIHEPDDIWFAAWNGQHSTSSPYIPAGDWSNHQRLHQYSGGHNESHGGVTINIDGDYLDVATAASTLPPIPDGTFVQVAGSNAIYRIAGGAPLYVSDWNAVGGPQPYTVISAAWFRALRPVPARGTFLETSNGTLYRVAGGAPIEINNPSLFPYAHPVIIDRWDIDNTGNPLAHLNTVPTNGTFLTTTAGGIYRIAGGAPIRARGWRVFGGIHSAVKVDQWDIDNRSDPRTHLRAFPADGTAVQGLRSRLYWVFVHGYRRPILRRGVAVAVDDVGLAPFAAVPCVVPRLRHLTLARSRGALRLADCRLGTLRGARRARLAILHVINQTPRPRTVHRPGYRVTITLG